MYFIIIPVTTWFTIFCPGNSPKIGALFPVGFIFGPAINGALCSTASVASVIYLRVVGDKRRSIYGNRTVYSIILHYEAIWRLGYFLERTDSVWPKFCSWYVWHVW